MVLGKLAQALVNMFFQDASPQIAVIETVPAPIGGLNARDSLVAMPATDAITLVNLWPQSYGVVVRNGYTEHAIGMVDPVKTIGQWSSVTGTEKMFAWAGTSVWDITTKGLVGAPVVTGLTNSRWSLVSLVNAAGSNLIGVNGADNGFVYNETGLHAFILGDGIVPYTWKNIDPKDAISVTIHQRRLWVVKKNSSIGWYLPPDAIYGIFESFDFGPLFYKGGYLEYLATWTLDDGNGAEDHLVAISNTGIAIVYAGTNPSDDTKWALVGVYNIGQPVLGRRAIAKVGGDLYILTAQGVVSMVNVLASTKVNEASAKFKSDKIQFLVSKLVNAYKAEDDWQLLFVPSINMLIVNVPRGILSSNEQLVSNQITEAWAMFANMDAAIWTTVSTQPYFGSYDGKVYAAWTGYLDDVKLDGTGGSSIKTEVQQAYNYFKSLGTQKEIGLYRMNLIVGSKVNYASSIAYDFVTTSLQEPNQVVPESIATWGISKWGQAKWSGGDKPQREWRVGKGYGNAASLKSKMSSTGSVMWVSTDFSITTGGLL
jgi:hypothetical protein